MKRYGWVELFRYLGILNCKYLSTHRHVGPSQWIRIESAHASDELFLFLGAATLVPQ